MHDHHKNRSLILHNQLKQYLLHLGLYRLVCREQLHGLYLRITYWENHTCLKNESCGGHFREEFQTKEGEAMRNDEEFTFVSAWEYNKVIENSTLHKEKLLFDNVELKNRSYK